MSLRRRAWPYLYSEIQQNPGSLVCSFRADTGITAVQGPVVATGTTPPAVTLTGTPTNVLASTIEIDITTLGTLGVAVFQWKFNGVVQQTLEVTAATFVLGTTGITANFPAGTYAANNIYTSVLTVSAWADRSSLANNVTQATATKQPALISSAGLGGKLAVSFNGTSDYLNFAGSIGVGGVTTTTASVAAVFVNNQTSGTGSVVSVTGFRLLNIIGGAWAYYSQQTGSGNVSALSNATAYCLIATQISTTNIPTWTNGTIVTLTNSLGGVADSPSTIGANANGANQWGHIDLSELVISTGAWSTNVVNEFRQYVTARYGFAA